MSKAEPDNSLMDALKQEDDDDDDDESAPVPAARGPRSQAYEPPMSDSEVPSSEGEDDDMDEEDAPQTETKPRVRFSDPRSSSIVPSSDDEDADRPGGDDDNADDDRMQVDDEVPGRLTPPKEEQGQEDMEPEQQEQKVQQQEEQEAVQPRQEGEGQEQQQPVPPPVAAPVDDPPPGMDEAGPLFDFFANRLSQSHDDREQKKRSLYLYLSITRCAIALQELSGQQGEFRRADFQVPPNQYLNARSDISEAILRFTGTDPTNAKVVQFIRDAYEARTLCAQVAVDTGRASGQGSPVHPNISWFPLLVDETSHLEEYEDVAKALRLAVTQPRVKPDRAWRSTAKVVHFVASKLISAVQAIATANDADPALVETSRKLGLTPIMDILNAAVSGPEPTYEDFKNGRLTQIADVNIWFVHFEALAFELALATLDAWNGRLVMPFMHAYVRSRADSCSDRKRARTRCAEFGNRLASSRTAVREARQGVVGRNASQRTPPDAVLASKVLLSAQSALTAFTNQAEGQPRVSKQALDLAWACAAARPILWHVNQDWFGTRLQERSEDRVGGSVLVDRLFGKRVQVELKDVEDVTAGMLDQGRRDLAKGNRNTPAALVHLTITLFGDLYHRHGRKAGAGARAILEPALRHTNDVLVTDLELCLMRHGSLPYINEVSKRFRPWAWLQRAAVAVGLRSAPSELPASRTTLEQEIGRTLVEFMPLTPSGTSGDGQTMVDLRNAIVASAHLAEDLALQGPVGESRAAEALTAQRDRIQPTVLKALERTDMGAYGIWKEDRALLEFSQAATAFADQVLLQRGQDGPEPTYGKAVDRTLLELRQELVRGIAKMGRYTHELYDEVTVQFNAAATQLQKDLEKIDADMARDIRNLGRGASQQQRIDDVRSRAMKLSEAATEKAKETVRDALRTHLTVKLGWLSVSRDAGSAEQFENVSDASADKKRAFLAGWTQACCARVGNRMVAAGCAQFVVQSMIALAFQTYAKCAVLTAADKVATDNRREAREGYWNAVRTALGQAPGSNNNGYRDVLRTDCAAAQIPQGRALGMDRVGKEAVRTILQPDHRTTNVPRSIELHVGDWGNRLATTYQSVQEVLTECINVDLGVQPDRLRLPVLAPVLAMSCVQDITRRNVGLMDDAPGPEGGAKTVAQQFELAQQREAVREKARGEAAARITKDLKNAREELLAHCTAASKLLQQFRQLFDAKYLPLPAVVGEEQRGTLPDVTHYARMLEATSAGMDPASSLQDQLKQMAATASVLRDAAENVWNKALAQAQRGLARRAALEPTRVGFEPEEDRDATRVAWRTLWERRSADGLDRLRSLVPTPNPNWIRPQQVPAPSPGQLARSYGVALARPTVADAVPAGRWMIQAAPGNITLVSSLWGTIRQHAVSALVLVAVVGGLHASGIKPFASDVITALAGGSTWFGGSVTSSAGVSRILYLYVDPQSLPGLARGFMRRVTDTLNVGDFFAFMDSAASETAVAELLRSSGSEIDAFGGQGVRQRFRLFRRIEDDNVGRYLDALRDVGDPDKMLAPATFSWITGRFLDHQFVGAGAAIDIGSTQVFLAASHLCISMLNRAVQSRIRVERPLPNWIAAGFAELAATSRWILETYSLGANLVLSVRLGARFVDFMGGFLRTASKDLAGDIANGIAGSLISALGGAYSAIVGPVSGIAIFSWLGTALSSVGTAVAVVSGLGSIGVFALKMLGLIVKMLTNLMSKQGVQDAKANAAAGGGWISVIFYIALFVLALYVLSLPTVSAALAQTIAYVMNPQNAFVVGVGAQFLKGIVNQMERRVVFQGEDPVNAAYAATAQEGVRIGESDIGQHVTPGGWRDNLTLKTGTALSVASLMSVIMSLLVAFDPTGWTRANDYANLIRADHGLKALS